jgi:hypothetical protein
MNRVLLHTLAVIMMTLIGSPDWGKVRAAVIRLMDADLPGEAKRRLAVSDLRAAGVTLSNALLNLAIEAAVVWAAPNKSESPP